MVADKKVKINKRRLARELVVIGAVGLVVFLVRFVPWLMQQPIPGYDPYAKYYGLFKEVESYDYTRGGSESLEKRLDQETSYIGSEPVGYYFKLKAKIYYYNRIGFYAYANQIADRAMGFVPTGEERLFVYSMYISNYGALGNDEKVAEYKAYYDDIAEIVGE